ncbi:MAG: hypothetical protein JO250_22430, partial [Armatimonadetes bacterium]|nr:hypothetical protein [Armatimonadota bacterium]
MNGPLPDLCRSVLQVGASVLLQSALLLTLGLLTGCLLRRRGPELRAFVSQMTLVAVVLGAVAAITTAGRFQPVWSVSLPGVAAGAEAPFLPPHIRSAAVPPPSEWERGGVRKAAPLPDTPSSPGTGKVAVGARRALPSEPEGVPNAEPEGVPTPPHRLPAVYVILA